MCDDKRYLVLNTAELLPNIYDHHHAPCSSDGDVEDGDPVLQRGEPEADEEEDRSECPQATWRQMICPPLDEGTDGAEHTAGDGDGSSDRQATQDTLDPSVSTPVTTAAMPIGIPVRLML